MDEKIPLGFNSSICRFPRGNERLRKENRNDSDHNHQSEYIKEISEKIDSKKEYYAEISNKI